MFKVSNRQKIILICFFVGVFFVYLTVRTFSYPYPNGRDAWFHILVARAYYRGENGMASLIVMNTNSIPYAPLYHLMLTPFVASLGTALLTQQILQCLFYPLSLLGLMLLANREQGFTTAMLFGMLLVGTYYGFGMTQARPQTLAMTLFPLAFYGALKNKALTFITTATAMFYLYSPIALALVLGMVVYKLRQKLFNCQVLAIALMVAPLLLYQATYTLRSNSDIYGRWIRVGDTGLFSETKDFFLNPVFFLWTGLGVSVIGLGLAGYKLYKYRGLAEFDKLMLLSFLGFLIMMPVWYQRVFQVAVVPLAFFTAQFIASRQREVKLALVLFVLWQAVIFSLFEFFMSPPPYLWKYW